MKTPTPVLAALTRPSLKALQWSTLPVLFGLVLAFGSSNAMAATASPPNLMTYQGFLVDANGNPLAPTTPANYPVTFRIYDASQVGQLIWSEQQIVTVDKGNFSVLLGEGSQVGSEPRPALANAFAGGPNSASASDRFIDITVTISGAPVLIAPRLRLVASPYAFLASSASSLVQPNGSSVVTYAGGQVTVTGNFNANGTLTASGRISGDGSGLTGLTAAQIPALDAAKITAGTLDAARIPTILTGNRAFTGGYVGIGTPTANSRLHVKDDSLPTAIFESSHPSGTWLALGNSSVSGRFWQLIMTGSGNGGGSLLLATGSAANTAATIPMEFRPDGSVRWSSGAFLANDQGGSLELGNSLTAGVIPFVDFHYGKGAAQDYNVRLINDVDGQLSLYGSLQVSGPILATGHILDLGAGVAGREVSAGKIGYQIFTPDALDIVGAGTPTVARKVKIWAEGGTTFNGPLDAVGTTTITMSDNGYNNNVGTYNSANNTWTASNSSNPGGAGIELYGMNGAGNYGNGQRFACPVTIRANGWIATGMGFVAYSDRRIKRDFQPSVTAQDLASIQKLKLTDYRMVDPADGGNQWRKGLIAQDVEEVIPGAVKRSVEFVPDIFSLSTNIVFHPAMKTLTVSLAKDHALKVGDRVRLHADGSRLDLNVSEVPSAHEFVVDECERAPENVFVYGRQVNDFRTVDYDRIFTTGIGAIQELAVKVKSLEFAQKQIAQLEKDAQEAAVRHQDELSELRREVAQLMRQPMRTAQLDALQRELDGLKQIVRELASVGKEPKTAAAAIGEERPSAVASARLAAPTTETIAAR